MDTGSWADLVSAGANVVVAIAAVVAASQGIAGLNAWRREAIGRRRMELAEDALTDLYEAADVIRWARFPGSFGYEATERQGRDDEPENIQAHRDTFYIPLKRLNDHSELFSRLRTRRFRVRATFGVDAVTPFEALHAVHSEIVVAAQRLMAMDPAHQNERTRERWERLEAVVWGVGDEDDKLVVKVGDALKLAETIFRPAIVTPGRIPES